MLVDREYFGRTRQVRGLSTLELEELASLLQACTGEVFPGTKRAALLTYVEEHWRTVTVPSSISVTMIESDKLHTKLKRKKSKLEAVLKNHRGLGGALGAAPQLAALQEEMGLDEPTRARELQASFDRTLSDMLLLDQGGQGTCFLHAEHQLMETR